VQKATVVFFRSAIVFKLSQAVFEREMIASHLCEAAHEQGTSTPTSQEPGIKGS